MAISFEESGAHCAACTGHGAASRILGMLSCRVWVRSGPGVRAGRGLVVRPGWEREVREISDWIGPRYEGLESGEGICEGCYRGASWTPRRGEGIYMRLVPGKVKRGEVELGPEGYLGAGVGAWVDGWMEKERSWGRCESQMARAARRTAVGRAGAGGKARMICQGLRGRPRRGRGTGGIWIGSCAGENDGWGRVRIGR